jgi:hypothetical protein
MDRDGRHRDTDVGGGGTYAWEGEGEMHTFKTEIEFSMNSSRSVYRALDSHNRDIEI